MSPYIRPIILTVGMPSISFVHDVRALGELHGVHYKLVALLNKKDIEPAQRKKKDTPDTVLRCAYNKPASIAKTLTPIRDHIVAVISRGEEKVGRLRKLIPHVPYIPLPTESSLEWATDKMLMRQQFEAYDPTITPTFSIVKETTPETIAKIKKTVGFPLVMKPAGLASSLLVTICFHEEELEAALKKVFRKINKVYKDQNRTELPKVLVEQFMEGEMYSIDGYVNKKGDITWCPFVHVKTGRSVGFDDFFGYRQMTPTTMKASTQDKGRVVAEKAVHALGMRSTTVHVELMRTDDGWKVIELGARIGGFRQTLYDLSLGLNHVQNDLLNRMGKKVIVPKKQKGYAAALKFFAKNEGTLSMLTGLKKIQKLESHHQTKRHLSVGDKCLFAKNGGRSVCDIVFYNENRSDLLADIRRAESMLKIEVERVKRKVTSQPQ